MTAEIDIAAETRDNGCACSYYIRHRAADEIVRLREALEEVMSWIKNWSPDFTEDDEWKATAEKASAALHTEEQTNGPRD